MDTSISVMKLGIYLTSRSCVFSFNNFDVFLPNYSLKALELLLKLKSNVAIVIRAGWYDSYSGIGP